jgi:hypothetical protein
MLHLSRAIIASFLFSLVVCSPAAERERAMPADHHCACHGHGAVAFLFHDGAGDEPKQVARQPVLVVIEAQKYRVTYPLAFAERLPVTELAKRIEEAMARVERMLGAFDTRIEMIIPGRIVTDDPDFPPNLSIAGVTWKEEDGQIHVAVALGSADVGTFAHELLHARLRNLGLSPPTWFEEGLAHFAESEDGFNESMYDLLKKEGPLTLAEIAKIKGVTTQEMRLRATGWAVAYYLVHIKGQALRDVAQLKELPDPKAAFAAIEKQREARGSMSQAPKTVIRCIK